MPGRSRQTETAKPQKGYEAQSGSRRSRSDTGDSSIETYNNKPKGSHIARTGVCRILRAGIDDGGGGKVALRGLPRPGWHSQADRDGGSLLTMDSPLIGRAEETKVIRHVLSEARRGSAGVLVLRGDPGIGKTALLGYADEYARRMGFLVLGTGGVQLESELPYATLHQLLRPVQDRLEALPAPQSAALRQVLELTPPVGDRRSLVSLALLGLITELSRDRPVLCLVDDLQWCDRASADVLLFTARRLRTEYSALVLAERAGQPMYRGAESLPELQVSGMDQANAEMLLASRHPKSSIPSRERIIGEAGGNPLALLELPVLADRREAGLMSPIPVTSRVRETLAAVLDQVQRLDDDTRTLLVIAATQDTADLGVLVAAADLVGVPPGALEVVERAGLLQVAAGAFRFRHQLLRSIAYHDAPFAQRAAAHLALARLLGSDEDADRRAWHLGAAAAGTDDDIADALQNTAWRAAARRDHSAIVLAYERAAELSGDHELAAGRLVVAARAAVDTGLLSKARVLRTRAAALTGDISMQTELAQVRGHVEFAQGHPRTSAEVLLAGNADAATLAAAVRYAWHAGDAALVAKAVSALDDLSPPDTTLVTGARALGHVLSGDLPAGRALLSDLGGCREPEKTEPWHGVWAAELLLVADYPERARGLSGPAVAEFRADGRFGCLAASTHQLAHALIALGEHREAGFAAIEGLRLAEETGQRSVAAHLRGWLSWLAAVEGDEERSRANAQECLRFAEENGHPLAAQHAVWALALLDLGHGRHQPALDRLESLWEGWTHLAARCAGDYVEAATRAGRPESADRVLEWCEQGVEPGSEQRTAAIAARCRALLRSEEAEAHFTEALRLHQISPQPFETARTMLLYGEWLRRHRRVIEARGQLSSALATFEDLHAGPWSARAQVELRVAGGPPTRREGPGVASALTARELQIVRLAADGATNRDIAAQTQLSPRTVGQHLYKAFPKLGVRSRAELRRRLA